LASQDFDQDFRLFGRLGLLMSSLARLLEQKRRLLERLQEGPGAHEREEIQRLLREIDAALALLDESGPGISGHRHE
jgi:hypothetical protein